MGEPALTIRRRVVVRGRVQGVGYRASCARRARQLGVGGFVRNRSDGSVEAAFEGDEQAVTALVDWCQYGPPWAEVHDVETFDEVPAGERAFTVG